MSLDKLIFELTQNTFVRLQISKVHGIGVFAIKDIPSGCRNMFSDEDGEWEKISIKEVEKMDLEIQALIQNFCLFDADFYYVPSKGFKAIDVSLFLNHSDQANLISIEEGRYFETTRVIKAGEELFLDYGSIVDSKE